MEPEDKYQVLPLIFGAVGELSKERRRAEGAVGRDCPNLKAASALCGWVWRRDYLGAHRKAFYLFIF